MLVHGIRTQCHRFFELSTKLSIKFEHLANQLQKKTTQNSRKFAHYFWLKAVFCDSRVLCIFLWRNHFCFYCHRRHSHRHPRLRNITEINYGCQLHSTGTEIMRFTNWTIHLVEKWPTSNLVAVVVIFCQIFFPILCSTNELSPETND